VLLAGLGPTTIGYLCEGAAKFGIYEGLKPTITNFLSAASLAFSLPSLNSRILSFVLCGSISGFVASILLCPMEALRIRMVAEPEFAKLGFVDGGIHMVKEEGGFRGVYKGLNAMVSKQVPYTVTKQVTFDTILNLAAANIAIHQVTSQIKFLITFLAAMVAGALSAISSQPGDTLLSLVNAHKGSKSTRDFSKELMRKHGIQGFFIGMKARFVHVGVMVTIQLLLYDIFKKICGISN